MHACMNVSTYVRLYVCMYLLHFFAYYLCLLISVKVKSYNELQLDFCLLQIRQI